MYRFHSKLSNHSTISFPFLAKTFNILAPIIHGVCSYSSCKAISMNPMKYCFILLFNLVQRETTHRTHWVNDLLCQSSLHYHYHYNENMIQAAWPELLTFSLHFTQTLPGMSSIILIAKRLIYDSAALILVVGAFCYEHGSLEFLAKDRDKLKAKVFLLKWSLTALTSSFVYLLFRLH